MSQIGMVSTTLCLVNIITQSSVAAVTFTQNGGREKQEGRSLRSWQELPFSFMHILSMHLYVLSSIPSKMGGLKKYRYYIITVRNVCGNVRDER